MGQRSTLRDVAALAGVSLASASRALHGTGASTTLTDRVRRAAEQLSYAPGVTGRALRTGRNSVVAVMVADIGNPVYVDMMRAVHDVVSPLGFQTIVTATGESGAAIAEGVRKLGAGFVDGVILAPLWMGDDLTDILRDAPVPVVVVAQVDGICGLDCVAVDSRIGVGLAVDHLVERGRTRLAFVNGPVQTIAGARRAYGFDAAMRRHGLKPLATAVAADFTIRAGAQAARTLLNIGPARPDAIVAANDLLAIGCMQALREAHLRIPGDVLITGMDNTEFGSAISPGLTSVDLQAYERARQATLLLLGRLDGDPAPLKHLWVTPQLVVRDSTGGPA